MKRDFASHLVNHLENRIICRVGELVIDSSSGVLVKVVAKPRHIAGGLVADVRVMEGFHEGLTYCAVVSNLTAPAPVLEMTSRVDPNLDAPCVDCGKPRNRKIYEHHASLCPRCYYELYGGPDSGNSEDFHADI
jgi:hypothetical protein